MFVNKNWALKLNVGIRIAVDISKIHKEFKENNRPVINRKIFGKLDLLVKKILGGK